MEIAKTMVLSTAHITQETARMLDAAHPSNGGRYGDYGWFFYAPEMRPDNMPEDMWRICTAARAADCAYVLMDRDASTVEHLPSYNW